MAILNPDIPSLSEDSIVYKIYKGLYDGMITAGQQSPPVIDDYINGGVVDEEGINTAMTQYSDILMKNSAYNTALSVFQAFDGNIGNNTQVFGYNRTSQAISDAEAINEAIGGHNVNNGDIVVITDYNDNQEIGKTGFVFNDTWVNLNGRVDANNIIVRGNLQLAGNYTNVGNITKGATETKILETNGLSVKTIFDRIFTQELQPTITQPSISSFVVKTNSSSGALSVEIGTTYKPYWNAVFNKGVYTYNDTGVAVTNWEVINNYNSTVFHSNTGIATDNVQQTASAFTMTIKATYSNGDLPVTNLGNPSNLPAIIGKTISTTASVTGYRKLFYGYETSLEAINNSTLTSTIIRGLNSKMNGSGALPTFPENTNAKRIIVAAPKGTRNITQVIMPSSSNANVTSEFKKLTYSIMVSGANNFSPIEYDVWIYEPAAMAGTYTITLN